MSNAHLPTGIAAPSWATVVQAWTQDSDGSWERWLKRPLTWPGAGGVGLQMLQVVEADGSFAQFGPEISIDIADETIRHDNPADVASDARDLARFLSQAADLIEQASR